MGRIFLLTLFAWVSVLSSVFAQQNNRFTSYTVNDGLPQSSIDDIAQDKDGFLWIGTAGGLSRFDGYSFKSYRHSANDPNSIIADKGFHFYLDSNRQFWIITYNGINLYDPAHDNFKSVLSFEQGNVITCDDSFFGEDEHFIYAGLCNYGVIKINKQTHHLSRINIPAVNKLANAHSWYHGFIEKDKLWIVANSNFVVYDIKTGQVRQLNIPLNSVANINTSQALGINKDGVVIIDKNKYTFQRYNLNKNGTEPNLNTILRLSDTLAILGSTTKGLYYFNTLSNTITRRIKDLGDEKHQPISAACLYKDRSGNLWIGSNGEGVYKMEYPFKNFKLYRSKAATNNVNCIYVDNSRLYVGNGGHGIDIFLRKDSFERNITVNKNIPAVVNTISAIAPAGKDKLLLVALSNKSKGNSKPFTFERSANQLQLLNGSVQGAFTNCWGDGNFRQFVFENGDNSILTNVGEYLLSLKQDEKGEWRTTIVHRFIGEKLSCCFRDRDNNLWIGTYKNLFRQINGNWEAASLPKTTEIKTINQDNAGNLWLGTNNGIYTLNTKQRVTNFYTEENGLLNEHIYGILKDDDGNMWFSHNKGLTVFYTKSKTFKHFGIEDGLQSAEFNSSAYFKAANGELFFGGINGVTSFFPKDIAGNPNSPAANITNILLFDKPYKTNRSYWGIHSLQLPYTDNSLSFEFAQPEYTQPLKNEYAYLLEGVDDKWINSGNKRFARYAGLRPGSYVFMVKAANSDGVWGAVNKIEILIIPPFWQRGWFVFLMIILCLSVVALAVLLIQKSIFKKKIRAFEIQQKIQSERERISRDLHDNIGTQLSLINKSIKEVIHPSMAITEDEKTKRLQSAQQGSSEVIDMIRETIWALNKSEITLEEFADNLKTFVQKKIAPYSSMVVEFTEQEENSAVKLGTTEALNLFRICQEAVSNTIKYASATKVHINLLAPDGKYKLIIKDNGIGFNVSAIEQNRHYGLENMKYRANEISCNLTIDAVPGKGTTINITQK